MNMLDSKCYQCGTRILVSQAAAKDPIAHICMKCSSMDDDDKKLWNQLADSLQEAAITDPDDEFDFETEEEEELVNPMIQWDVDMAADDYIKRLNEKPKCCCGAEAIKSKLHSDWCDIVTKGK